MAGSPVGSRGARVTPELQVGQHVRRRLDPDVRREAILDAARIEFTRTPFSRVKISDIAAASQSSPALIYRYFNGKDELYARVIQDGLAAFRGTQEAALASLPPNASIRDHVRTIVETYVDFVRDNLEPWMLAAVHPGAEPAVVAPIHAAARDARIERLRGILAPSDQSRHHIAVSGFYGFLDAACLAWADAGCPPEQRASLVEAALGALQGALGDWSA